MKFIHNLQFTIVFLAFGFLAASCHTNTSPGKGVGSADSVSKQHGDTITPKINFYTGRIASKPNDADAYWNRGKLELQTKSLGPAFADLSKAVALDTTKSDYYYTLADIEFILGRTHEARDAFETSTRLNPKNTDAILKLAELYFYVKKYDDAIDLIDQAIKVNPYLSREYFLKGMIFMEKGDTSKAISSMQTAVEQDPDYFDAYIQLGLLFAHKGNPVALTYYDDAIHLKPNNPEPYYDKGMFYQFGEDYDNAIKAYTELLQIDSTYKNAYYNLGVIYNLNKADYVKSLTYFNKAIKCDTAYFMAYFGRGNCYEMLNQTDNALADYAHAYRINPNFKDAAKAYQYLKSKKH
jgi:tetratricopeptide (TPR) repeat protein